VANLGVSWQVLLRAKGIPATELDVLGWESICFWRQVLDDRERLFLRPCLITRLNHCSAQLCSALRCSAQRPDRLAYLFFCTLGAAAVRRSTAFLSAVFVPTGRSLAGTAQRLIVWQVLRGWQVLAVGSTGRVIKPLAFQVRGLPRPLVGVAAMHAIEMCRGLLATAGVTELLTTAMLGCGGAGAVQRRLKLIIVAELEIA